VLDQIAAWGDALKAPADKRLKKQLRRDRSLPGTKSCTGKLYYESVIGGKDAVPASHQPHL
jgi:hypothetical protein